ncbi:AraC family transcriptional regulator [Paenibacillus kyungheensis]
MLRLKLKFLLQNKQTRLMLLLTIVLSVLITTIALFSYSRYRQELDTELNTPNIELLQINLDVTNRAFRESDNKAVDASFHPDILNYIQANPAGTNYSVQVNQAQRYLKTLASDQDIYSIDIITLDQQHILSSQYGYRADWQQSPDNTWTSWIQQIKQKPLLIQRRWYGKSATDGQIELLSLARPIVIHEKVIGAVMINLDYDRFFSKFYVHLSNEQIVYDLDGHLIYPKLSASVPINEMDQVITELGVQPFAYVDIHGQDYMANQTFSDVTGWRLVSLVPMEQLLKHVKLARNMMLLLSLISIAIGCAAVYSYSYAAFRPLKRINKLLHPTDQQQPPHNLYDLEPAISKLIGDLHSTSFLAERSLPELRSKYIQDVLHQHIGLQELDTKWNYYFQDWESDLLVVTVISIDRYRAWTTSYSSEDQMLLKYALHNMMLEILDSHWRVVSINADKDYFTFLLQPKSAYSITWTDQWAIDMERCIQIVKEHLNVSISVGGGSSVETIAQTPSSYTEAITVLSYRLYNGYGRIQHMPQDHASATTFPLEQQVWIQEMVDRCEQADQQTALLWMDKGLNDIQEHSITPTEAYKMLDQGVHSLLQWAQSHEHTLPVELANYYSGQLNTLTLEEIKTLLRTLITELVDEHMIYRVSREHLLVQNMQSYLSEHLHENIGLPDVAHHVQMSVSSVSAIFKEETGSTLYDYLTHLRMSRACQLLLDTELKISEIAGQVGYQNENSFIRTFRKHKATTPGKFREIHKSTNRHADPPNR